MQRNSSKICSKMTIVQIHTRNENAARPPTNPTATASSSVMSPLSRNGFRTEGIVPRSATLANKAADFVATSGGSEAAPSNATAIPIGV